MSVTTTSVLEQPIPATDPRLARLSLNTATTKRWTLAEAVDGAVRAGISSIGVWRDRLAECGLPQAISLINDAGLRVSSLCRGGFLTASDPTGISAALEDNRRAIEEAAALGTRNLEMVVGGLPPGDRDLVGARHRVADRIAELVPYAAQHNVCLVLEALHPMYCADRAVLSTLEQALDLAAPFPSSTVGVVIDTFHLWWDPQLPELIARAGRENRIAGYQVCDFLMPMTPDPLMSRGLMGDGVIDFSAIGRSVHHTGYAGDVEVEIFNEEVWSTPGDRVLEAMKSRYVQLVLPSLTGIEPHENG